MTVCEWWILHWRRGIRTRAARKKKSKEDQSKSKAEEEAKGENTSYIRREKERRNYQAHQASYASRVKKVMPKWNEGIGSTSNSTEIRVSTFEKSPGIISFKIPDNPLQTGQA